MRLYNEWMADRAFCQVPMQALVTQWLQSFKDFPVRQSRPASTSSAVMDKSGGQAAEGRVQVGSEEPWRRLAA